MKTCDMARRAGLLARVGLSLALLVAAGSALGRGCLDPTANVGCTVDECLALQADVEATKGSPSCDRIAGCTPLRAAKQRWLDHYEARSRINVRCYAGGDPGHQLAASNAIEHVSRYDARIALPAPTGCGDPCP